MAGQHTTEVEGRRSKEMAADSRPTRSASILYVILLAFVLFAGWQVVYHYVFMVAFPLRSMLAMHLVPLTVETALAAFVVVVVVRSLVRLNRQLTELDRQKAMLTDLIVHDLRQPLSALIAGLSSLSEGAELSAQAKELVDISQRSGLELLEMVNDLLDITRLEAGQPLIERGPVAPRKLMLEGTEGLRELAAASGLDLSVEAPEGLPDVQADRERLRRVVVNLVGNAIKFTPAGGRIRVSADLDQGRESLLIRVSDTGMGVPPEMRERVFDKFAVGEARSSGGRSSTGLGLAFCKMVVEAHGGRIWVDSEVGRGSTFTVSVPLGGAEVEVGGER